MQFELTQTSGCSETEPPYPQAKRATVVKVDWRTVDDPMKNSYIGASWYEVGVNHRVVNGCICRDFLNEVWVVEINTLEELLKLAQEVKSELVLTLKNKPELPSIEIYDARRE